MVKCKNCKNLEISEDKKCNRCSVSIGGRIAFNELHNLDLGRNFDCDKFTPINVNCAECKSFDKVKEECTHKDFSEHVSEKWGKANNRKMWNKEQKDSYPCSLFEKIESKFDMKLIKGKITCFSCKHRKLNIPVLHGDRWSVECDNTNHFGNIWYVKENNICNTCSDYSGDNPNHPLPPIQDKDCRKCINYDPKTLEFIDDHWHHKCKIGKWWALTDIFGEIPCIYTCDDYNPLPVIPKDAKCCVNCKEAIGEIYWAEDRKQWRVKSHCLKGSINGSIAVFYLNRKEYYPCSKFEFKATHPLPENKGDKYDSEVKPMYPLPKYNGEENCCLGCKKRVGEPFYLDGQWQCHCSMDSLNRHITMFSRSELITIHNYECKFEPIEVKPTHLLPKNHGEKNYCLNCKNHEGDPIWNEYYWTVKCNKNTTNNTILSNSDGSKSLQSCSLFTPVVSCQNCGRYIGHGNCVDDENTLCCSSNPEEVVSYRSCFIDRSGDELCKTCCNFEKPDRCKKYDTKIEVMPTMCNIKPKFDSQKEENKMENKVFNTDNIKVLTRNCTNCNELCTSEARYCSRCGHDLTATIQELTTEEKIENVDKKLKDIEDEFSDMIKKLKSYKLPLRKGRFDGFKISIPYGIVIKKKGVKGTIKIENFITDIDVECNSFKLLKVFINSRYTDWDKEMELKEKEAILEKLQKEME